MLRKIPANFATKFKLSCVETSNTGTKNMTESSLMTMTERGQNQLKTEAMTCENLLLAHKKLLMGKVTRFKEIIRQFHLTEENGLSTKPTVADKTNATHKTSISWSFFA